MHVTGVTHARQRGGQPTERVEHQLRAVRLLGRDRELGEVCLHVSMPVVDRDATQPEVEERDDGRARLIVQDRLEDAVVRGGRVDVDGRVEELVARLVLHVDARGLGILVGVRLWAHDNLHRPRGGQHARHRDLPVAGALARVAMLTLRDQVVLRMQRERRAGAAGVADAQGHARMRDEKGVRLRRTCLLPKIANELAFRGVAHVTSPNGRWTVSL